MRGGVQGLGLGVRWFGPDSREFVAMGWFSLEEKDSKVTERGTTRLFSLTRLHRDHRLPVITQW